MVDPDVRKKGKILTGRKRKSVGRTKRRGTDHPKALGNRA